MCYSKELVVVYLTALSNYIKLHDWMVVTKKLSQYMPVETEENNEDLRI
jgi:hypothetical protein